LPGDGEGIPCPTLELSPRGSKDKPNRPAKPVAGDIDPNAAGEELAEGVVGDVQPDAQVVTMNRDA
jgi:hypothetical protein